MRAKVSTESEDYFISVRTPFHPAQRKMVPVCQRFMLLSQDIINILLGLLLHSKYQNAGHSTYSNNIARLPLNAQKRLCHYCELHGISKKALLSHLIFLVSRHFLNRQKGKHINRFNISFLTLPNASNNYIYPGKRQKGRKLIQKNKVEGSKHFN